MNPSTSLARAVVDGLLAEGVRHVVLAPGSRSAPLAYELLAPDGTNYLMQSYSQIRDPEL